MAESRPFFRGFCTKTDWRKGAVAACLLAALAALGGCRDEEVGSAGPDRPTVGVAEPLERPVVEYAYFTGQAQALESVQVRARVTGYLEKICYEPGKEVKAGDLLFEVDPASYQDQLNMSLAKVAQARGQVEEAKANIVQAQAQLDVDRSKLARDEEVAKTPGALSQQQLDVSRAAVKQSEATLAAAKATVVALEASVQAAEAEVAVSQLNLGWTKVRSPIDGRVDRNLLTVGNLVTADVTNLTNIVATARVYVYFDVDELTFLNVRQKVRQGAYQKPDRVPIAVALQNEQGYPHKGMLDLVANAMSAGTGTMQVRAVLDNPQGILTPGSFVRVRLPVDEPRNKLLVPDRAVIYQQGVPFLLIVDGESKVDQRKVTLGPLDPEDNTLRVIEEGVKAGEQVIVQGRQRVRPDAQVNPQPVAQPSP